MRRSSRWPPPASAAPARSSSPIGPAAFAIFRWRRTHRHNTSPQGHAPSQHFTGGTRFVTIFTWRGTLRRAQGASNARRRRTNSIPRIVRLDHNCRCTRPRPALPTVTAHHIAAARRIHCAASVTADHHLQLSGFKSIMRKVRFDPFCLGRQSLRIEQYRLPGRWLHNLLSGRLRCRGPKNFTRVFAFGRHIG